MELRVKQYLFQIQKLFAASLLSCGILGHISLPSQASLEGGRGDEGTRGQGSSLIFPPSSLLPPSSPPLPLSPSSPPLLAAEESENLDNSPEILTPQTSVSQLSDVQPTDWAYQVLQTLMERYGVISGYPNGTFRGNRPVSRYEFAAGLAATLDKVDSLIASAIGDEYIQQDAITLRRLQKEYRAALDELRQNADKITDRADLLEGNQFSATTKLQGQQITALTDGSNANKTIVSRTRLTLSTSFQKTDLLVTQLESGNNGGDAIGLAQKEKSGSLVDGGGLDYGDVESGLKLRRLYYTFRPTPDVAVTVGAKMSPRDFIDRNRYANNEAVDFSSSFFINNPLIVQRQIDRNGGAGAAIAWNPKGSKFAVRSLYIAKDADVPNSTTNGGLFGDNKQASVEVEFSPSNQLALRLQYTNAKVNNTDINAVGVNAEYSLNRNSGIFGRLGVGNYQGLNTALNRNLDLQPISWAVGMGLRNLVIPGTVAGVAIGQPFVSGGFGNATQTNFEAFYNLQLNDNISVTPTVSLVNNANNQSSSGTIWESTLRTVFSF